MVGLILPFLIILPFFLNDYYRDIMTLTCIYIVLALGLNIIVGQAGLLNLGYVAFYAIGAYTYAILSTKLGLSFWPGLAAGGRPMCHGQSHVRIAAGLMLEPW